MVTCVKIFTILACFAFCCTAKAEKETLNIISTSGPDIPFREILIAKSMEKDAFSCTVIQDTFENAMQKLSHGSADIVLIKKSPLELKLNNEQMAVYQYASTQILAAVNRRNNLKKISISDLRKIWNENYNSWNIFDQKNIFSIHRFGMRLDDGSFLYLKNFLKLNQDASHFPLENSQQIIAMIAANPNAIGIFTFDESSDFSTINLLQITDNNGKNIKLQMPHTAIFLKKNQQKIKKFLKVKKDK